MIKLFPASTIQYQSNKFFKILLLQLLCTASCISILPSQPCQHIFVLLLFPKYSSPLLSQPTAERNPSYLDLIQQVSTGLSMLYYKTLKRSFVGVFVAVCVRGGQIQVLLATVGDANFQIVQDVESLKITMFFCSVALFGVNRFQPKEPSFKS